MENTDRKGGFGWAFAGFAAVFAVCLPLFFRTMGHGTCNDWLNHCWMANYFARYFCAHLAFPHTLNTSQLIGLPYPVFYGFLFYPIMGMCSTIFDANVTIRLLAIIVLAAQFFLIYKSTVSLSKDRWLAFTLSSIVTWAIYPLTNLYHRAAIPEFFACIFLTCASVAWMRAITAPSDLRLRLWANFAVLCLCAAAGTHPITAVYGIVAFAAQVLLGLIARPSFGIKKTISALLIPSALAVICLAPWVVSAKRYSHDFQVAGGFDKVGYFMLSVDSPQLRLSPIPLPSSMLKDGIVRDHMTTPHLDAQINLPLALLLVVVVFALWRRKKLDWRVAAVIAVLTALTFWIIHLSDTFGAASRLGYVFRCVQFAYRLVTYINLLLLCAAMFAIAQLGNPIAKPSSVSTDEKPSTTDEAKPLDKPSVSNDQKPANTTAVSTHRDLLNKPALAVVLAVSAVAMVLKVAFAFEMQPIEPHWLAGQRTDAELLQLPPSFYGFQTYAMPRILNELSKQEIDSAETFLLTPRAGSRFGEVAPVPLPLTGQKWIATNVQEFAWNKLFLNGEQLSTDDIGGADMKIAVKNSPAGVLSYQFKPASSWVLLDLIAVPFFLLWIAGTAFVFFKMRAQGSELLPDCSVAAGVPATTGTLK